MPGYRKLGAILLAGAAVTLAALANPPAGARAAGPIKWFLNGPSVTAFAQDSFASSYFNGSRPFIMMGKSSSGVPPSWEALRVQSFTSYAAMQKAFDAGAIKPGTRYVMYDAEHWEFTPMEEQQNYPKYVAMCAQLAHSHNMLLIATPATNLIQVMAPGSGPPQPRYLNAKIAAASAVADVFDIQAQGMQKKQQKFVEFTRAAAAQARQVNPRIVVLAGVSTGPTGHTATAPEIAGVIRASRSYLDGYWMNVPQKSEYCQKCGDFRPDIAIDVFKMVGK